MLRITPCETAAAQPCLRLEGRLVGPWVTELRAAVDALGVPLARLHLDLSRVQFADADGLALLHQLQDQGAVLHAPSRFLEELLHTRPQ